MSKHLNDRTDSSPVTPAPAHPATSLADRFAALARQWKQETAYASSLTEKKAHPAYQQVIGLGNAAIPLILAELRREPDFWFAALQAITGEDPVQPTDRGQVRRMTAAWLAWGQTHGY